MSRWPSSNETVKLLFLTTYTLFSYLEGVTIITISLNNTLQSSIQEVPGANLSLKSNYPDQCFSWSFFVSPAKHNSRNSN